MFNPETRSSANQNHVTETAERGVEKINKRFANKFTHGSQGHFLVVTKNIQFMTYIRIYIWNLFKY